MHRTTKQVQKNHEEESSHQKCRNVLAEPKAPTHEEQEEFDYPNEAVTKLTVAIYQCKLDLKRFHEQYEDTTAAFNCNMKTNLKKQFRSH